MKHIARIPESAMVAAFLKAEISSPRFSDAQKAVMQRLNISEQIITDPNLEDEQDNHLRAKVLGEYRGYKQSREIFQDFPHDLTWFKAVLSRDEIGNLRYVDYSYWNELTDNTHLVKDGVKNIQNGKVVFNVSNDRFMEVAEKIKQGTTNFEPIILTGSNDHSPLTILEGHLRATGFGLAGDKAPKEIEVIVGLKQPGSNVEPILSGLVLLIGPPGAGKTTFAQKLIAQYSLDKKAHISNDAIANELFGVDIDRGDKDGEIFTEQDSRIKERLENGRVAIVDATNVKPEARKRILDIAKQYDQPVTAFCFRRDEATLLKQNQMREVKVSESMVREYAELMSKVADEQLRSEGITVILEA